MLVIVVKNSKQRCIKGERNYSNHQLNGIVSAKPLAFLEDARGNAEGARVFRLADLANMYTAKMEQLGADTAERAILPD